MSQVPYQLGQESDLPFEQVIAELLLMRSEEYLRTAIHLLKGCELKSHFAEIIEGLRWWMRKSSYWFEILAPVVNIVEKKQRALVGEKAWAITEAILHP